MPVWQVSREAIVNVNGIVVAYIHGFEFLQPADERGWSAAATGYAQYDAGVREVRHQRRAVVRVVRPWRVRFIRWRNGMQPV